MRVCNNCGSEVQEGQKYCRNCGCELSKLLDNKEKFSSNNKATNETIAQNEVSFTNAPKRIQKKKHTALSIISFIFSFTIIPA